MTQEKRHIASIPVIFHVIQIGSHIISNNVINTLSRRVVPSACRHVYKVGVMMATSQRLDIDLAELKTHGFTVRSQHYQPLLYPHSFKQL